ncbi:MAG: hypothetical protein IOC29_13855, partial [Burkholderia sp.]|nr:hypothetical protein [Burkholderia sp.]
HIARMDTVDDPQSLKLDALQAAFGYPWLPAKSFARGLVEAAAAHPNWGFLAPFHDAATAAA